MEPEITAASSLDVRDLLVWLIFRKQEKKNTKTGGSKREKMSVSQRFSDESKTSIVKITIDSQHSVNFPTDNPHTYVKWLPTPIKGVNAMSVDSVVIPNTWSCIDPVFHNTSLIVTYNSGAGSNTVVVDLNTSSEPIYTGADLAVYLKTRLDADTGIVWVVTFNPSRGTFTIAPADGITVWRFERFTGMDTDFNKVYTLIGFAQKINNMSFTVTHQSHHIDLQPLHVIHIDFGKGWHQCYNDATNVSTQAIISLDENPSTYNVWTNKKFAKQLFFFNAAETTIDVLKIRLLTPSGEPVPFKGGHWTMTLSAEVITGTFGNYASPLLYMQ